jgi:hypothetical protein
MKKLIKPITPFVILQILILGYLLISIYYAFFEEASLGLGYSIYILCFSIPLYILNRIFVHKFKKTVFIVEIVLILLATLLFIINI